MDKEELRERFIIPNEELPEYLERKYQDYFSPGEHHLIVRRNYRRGKEEVAERARKVIQRQRRLIFKLAILCGFERPMKYSYTELEDMVDNNWVEHPNYQLGEPDGEQSKGVLLGNQEAEDDGCGG